MSQKLFWTFGRESGTLPLPNRSIALLAQDGLLDQVAQLQGNQSGMLLDVPGEGGKMILQSSGALRFLAQGKEYRKVMVPAGGEISFMVHEAEGQLRFTGSGVNDPLLGTSLGGYELKIRLGAGAVGVVYQAAQTSLQRDVALKVLSEKAAADPKAIHSFVREAQSAGRLTHPNLVQVHDVGKAEGKHYYSMELVPGGNLEEKLEADGPLPWREAVSAARDCALALAFAEEHGLVHRDVKPENLMLSEAGLVKLADLGLAATREMLDGESAGGTPHFMAPESSLGRGVDGRADLYSLGCSLYRLLTGETLFEGSSVREILRAHQEDEPPSLEDFDIVLPKGLNDLVTTLLEKDPADRPAHASEVAEDLELILQSKGRRKTFVLLSFVFVLLTAWILRESLREDSLDPKTIFIEVESPDAEKTRLQLEAAQVEVAYNQALAQVPLTGRLTALLNFQEEYSESPFGEDLELRIADLRKQIKADMEKNVEAEGEVNREKKENQALKAELAQIRTLAEKNQWADALALVVESTFVAHPSFSAMASWLLGNSEEYAQELEQKHRNALNILDWAQAKTIHAEWTQSLGHSRADWSGRLSLLQTLAAQAELRQEDFQQQEIREAFLTKISSPTRKFILQFQGDAALTLWSARGQERFQGESWDATVHALGITAKKSAEFQATAGRGDIDNYRTTETGKRAAIRAWEETGLVIELTERGERIQETLPWSTFSDPPTLTRLLETLAPTSFDHDATGTYFLVHASSFVAETAQRLLQETPSQVAVVAHAWIAEYRAHWEDTPVNAGLILQLEALAQLAQSLASGDDYLALQRLEDFGHHFHLLPLWLSDGTQKWSLNP